MNFHTPAYDAEAVYPWWEQFQEPDGRAGGKVAGFEYDGPRLQEFLAGLRAVADVHLKHQLPATFFLVARLLESAGREIREMLDHPIFDIQCHTFNHRNLVESADDPAVLKRELCDSKKLIEDTFGRRVIGLTTPGGYRMGFVGQDRLLQAIAEAGYRYVRSFGAGPRSVLASAPAPLHQPFWYAAEGQPDILELHLHAWHDNILTGQPAVIPWPPLLPWGYPAHLPKTAEEAFQAYAPGVDYAAGNNLLLYDPVFHPWSIYRFDKQARHVELLILHARRLLTVASCTTVYEWIKAHPDEARSEPPV